MSDAIDLFEPEGFIPSDLRPPHITFKPRKTKRINEKTVSAYQHAHKRVATESVEHINAKKSKRLGKDFNPSHRLSMRLEDGQGASRASS